MVQGDLGIARNESTLIPVPQKRWFSPQLIFGQSVITNQRRKRKAAARADLTGLERLYQLLCL